MRIHVGNMTFVPFEKLTKNDKGELIYTPVDNIFAIPGRKKVHKDKIRDWANRTGQEYSESK